MNKMNWAKNLTMIDMTVILLLSGVFWIPSALGFNFDVGEVGVSADFTLGYGASFRTEDASTTATSPNFKSETTYEDPGIVANVFKATAEIEADWRNSGAVCNLNYTYDSMIMNEDTDREGKSDPDFLFGLTTIDTGMGNRWNSGAEDESGSSFDILDAYVYGRFINDSLDIRIGRQVINWGEGLFFLDGVAEQTPLNINKLVLPGSELKEAYIGNGAVQTQLAVTDSWSVDAYMQWEWQENKFPGVGTFYGDDILGPGGKEEWENDSLLPGLRGSDIDADSGGQWGISTRLFMGDVEVGLYYSRYHEKMPVFRFESNPASPDLAQVLYYTPELNGGLTPADWAAIGVTGPGDLAGMPVPGTKLRQVYLEDSNMFGGSIASTLGPFSVNAEVAYRPDRPLVAPVADYLLVQDGDAWLKRDTVNVSAHVLWLGGAFLSGIDSQFAAVQLGMDYVDDPEGLAVNNVIHNNPDAQVDETAWGLAASWEGTWQSVASRSIDVTLSMFLHYDFSGNSHFWGNFAEDRLLTSIGLTGNFGNAWEANITYARQDFSDSQYENQDTVNFSVNYKF